jgi:hypothetical protein
MADISTVLNKVNGALRVLDTRVKALESQDSDLTFREQKIKEAAFALPRWYTIDFTVTDTTTDMINGSVTITQEGWFFLDRIYVVWRTTNNRYRAISAGGNSANIAQATLQNEINFTWNYQDGRTQMWRAPNDLPGDILWRGDKDGMIPHGGDSIGPNAPINAHITPILATGVAGTLTMVFQGVQCLDNLRS